MIDVPSIYKKRTVYPFPVEKKIKPEYLTAAHKFGQFKVRKSNWCDLFHLFCLLEVIKKNRMILAVLPVGTTDKCANSVTSQGQIIQQVKLLTMSKSDYDLPF